MEHNIYVYIFIMAFVSLLIRLIPLTLIRRPIKNLYLRSFLYYVPYVTLAVMTFPAMIYATQTPISGALAFLAGLLLAYLGLSLFQVAAACSIVVFLAEQMLLR